MRESKTRKLTSALVSFFAIIALFSVGSAGPPPAKEQPRLTFYRLEKATDGTYQSVPDAVGRPLSQSMDGWNELTLLDEGPLEEYHFFLVSNWCPDGNPRQFSAALEAAWWPIAQTFIPVCSPGRLTRYQTARGRTSALQETARGAGN
ncbi:MAG: hypothetical protein LBJ38_02520, partial [Oscillospiraceae bacterium]|nr:hypothetical protein [Oscillospiraceae bacterium]